VQTKIEHIVVENDFVVFLNDSGIHAGEFRGKSPTNKRVDIRSADLYKIENEKIVEHWDGVDISPDGPTIKTTKILSSTSTICLALS
jgi:predicted ester cyclase